MLVLHLHHSVCLFRLVCGMVFSESDMRVWLRLPAYMLNLTTLAGYARIGETLLQPYQSLRSAIQYFFVTFW